MVSGEKRFWEKARVEVEKVRKEKSKSNEMTQLGFKLKRKWRKELSQRSESTKQHNTSPKGDRIYFSFSSFSFHSFILGSSNDLALLILFCMLN